MFYIVLGESLHPLQNRIFTESDIEKMKKLPQAAEWTFVPVEAPWNYVEWVRQGGRGNSPYPKGAEIQMIRCPKTIAYKVQQFAIWMANESSE